MRIYSLIFMAVFALLFIASAGAVPVPYRHQQRGHHGYGGHRGSGHGYHRGHHQGGYKGGYQSRPYHRG
ncbi:hypothetical protein TNIN_104671 [Trichonephila inaurata madagascariensis]|uniref:Uncharacterized protein n=1 Tax=Trichonephila inaurata madagascariensis TaxID=2747483 RepID=A0A8X6YD92_9ARAC|nr:hypothetical protein TNIN_104671 [Trichonephila inaurata madagascariensis]